MENLCVHLKSDAVPEFFPTNSMSNFRNKTSTPLDLDPSLYEVVKTTQYQSHVKKFLLYKTASTVNCIFTFKDFSYCAFINPTNSFISDLNSC